MGHLRKGNQNATHLCIDRITGANWFVLSQTDGAAAGIGIDGELTESNGKGDRNGEN